MGTGYAVGTGVKRKDALKKLCTTCKGTGKYKATFYHHVAETPDGQKIAIDGDTVK
jgi:hypothetical protein